jgi:hypothetical protein
MPSVPYLQPIEFYTPAPEKEDVVPEGAKEVLGEFDPQGDPIQSYASAASIFERSKSATRIRVLPPPPPSSSRRPPRPPRRKKAKG